MKQYHNSLNDIGSKNIYFFLNVIKLYMVVIKLKALHSHTDVLTYVWLDLMSILAFSVEKKRKKALIRLLKITVEREKNGT